MSVKDLPDYTRQVVIRYEGGFIGLEELAARLGSIVPYDLRGNIVLMEDFESEPTEWGMTQQIGSSTTRSSSHKYSGDWSIKLYNSGGSPAFKTELWRSFPFSGTSKYALFSRIAWDYKLRWFRYRLDLYDGVKSYSPEVKFNLPTYTLQVITTGGSYYTVASDLNLSKLQYTWYPMLVTFNLQTGCYDKLYFAHGEYDISTVPLWSSSIVTTPEMTIYFMAGSPTSTVFTIYVDDIIIAKNVP